MQDSSSLVVPVITIYEVFKVVLRESGENKALQAVATMHKGKIIDLTTSIAMNAAKISLHHNLPMADSIILSTVYAYDCTIWTQDADFENIPGVKFFSKR